MPIIIIIIMIMIMKYCCINKSNIYLKNNEKTNKLAFFLFVF